MPSFLIYFIFVLKFEVVVFTVKPMYFYVIMIDAVEDCLGSVKMNIVFVWMSRRSYSRVTLSRGGVGTVNIESVSPSKSLLNQL